MKKGISVWSFTGKNLGEAFSLANKAGLARRYRHRLQTIYTGSRKICSQ